MILYKYLSPENALRVVGSRKLRFTPPSQLNDPFELRPHYQSLNDAPEIQEQLTDDCIRNVLTEEIDKQLDQMPQEILSLIPREFFHEYLSGVAPLTKQIAPTLFEGLTDVFGESLYSNLDRLVGILCLTETNDNTLMWAHYADSHRGVVLGFDSTSPFFERRLHGNDDFRHLEKVSYKPTPSVQIINIEDGSEILYTKNLEWEYEQEWRMVMPLQDADDVRESGPVAIHLFQFPPVTLREVIFGCKASEDTRNEILSTIEREQNYSHVRNFSAHLDEKNRTLEIEEIC